MNMPGIRTVAVAFALLAFSGTALADLSDGLVVKYSFDSLGTDGQLADESGNGHTLTLGSGLSLTNGPMPGMKAMTAPMKHTSMELICGTHVEARQMPKTMTNQTMILISRWLILP